MNIFRKIGAIIFVCLPLLQACNSIGVRGTALRVPTDQVSNVVLDISQAGSLMGPFWNSDLAPAIATQAPAAFGKYGVKTDTYTLVNEAKTRPTPQSQNTYLLLVTANSRYSGSSGTLYDMNITFLNPQGVKLWAGRSGFAWNPVRDYNETAKTFVEKLAQQLNDAGMFRGNSAAAALSTTPFEYSAAARAALDDYKFKPYPKAFVVEDGGRWITVFGRAIGNEGTPSERALKACTDAGFKGCRVLAVDNTIYE